MLQLNDRDVSIHDCRFEAYFDKVNVNIKFPCSFYIQWNSINGKNSVQTQSHIKTKSNMVVFDQKVNFNAELIYDKRKKKYLKKDSIINLSLTSKNRPDQVKLVGRVTVDLSDIISTSKYSDVQSHKLSYCSVQSEIFFSLKFIKSDCLNKSISDLDKSSFHDLYSFKLPIPTSNTLNTTKQTKQQTRENIHVEEIETVKQQKIIPDNVLEQDYHDSKQKKNYRRNQNIILINERNLIPKKQTENKANSTEKQLKQQSKQKVKQNAIKPTSSQKDSSVHNLPINQKVQQSSVKQISTNFNRTPLSPRLTESQYTQKKPKQHEQQLLNLKTLLNNKQKQLQQKSISINQLQQKIKYFQRIIKDSKSQQDELQRAKLSAHKLQAQVQKLQSVEIALRKDNEQFKSQLQKANLMNVELEKKVKQTSFSLNTQIVEYKQSIQNLELTVKQKMMQIEYANKKASLIEQNLNHFRLLQSTQVTNTYQHSQPPSYQPVSLNEDQQSRKRIKSLQNRIDSLLELNKRHTQQANQKKKLIDEINSRLTFKTMQVEQKNKLIQQLNSHLQDKNSQAEKLKAQSQSSFQRSIEYSSPKKQQTQKQTNLVQELKNAQNSILQYQKSELQLKQKILNLQQNIRQLQNQIIKCRDPSCFAPSEASRMTPGGENNLFAKSQFGQGSDNQIIRAQQTISYLAKQKEMLLIEKNSIAQSYRALEQKFIIAQNEITHLKDELKKYNGQPSQMIKHNKILTESVNNQNNPKNQHSLSAQNVHAQIKSSNQGLNQTMSKLSQIQKSIHQLNIVDPEIIILDPVKAILLAQLQLLKSQNKKISQQLSKLKITIRQPVSHINEDPLVDETIIQNPQLANFSQQLRQESVRGLSLNNNQLNLISNHQQGQQTTAKKSQQQINQESIREESQFIHSIQQIDSSKKSQLLLQTRKIDSPPKDKPQKQQHQMTLLENNSGPQLHQLDNIRFSQAGQNLKGTRVPVLKKNTQSVWDMESNFSGRQFFDHNAGHKQKSIKSNMSKNTQFMDDNQFRIMSIDDHAEVQQLRIIVREQQSKIKSLSQTTTLLQKKLKQIETQKSKILQQFNTLSQKHQQSSSQLERVWKQKQDLIYQLMFGKQSSITKPHQEFGANKKDAILKQHVLQDDQPISISIKQSQKPSSLDSSSKQSQISRARTEFNNRGRMFLDTAALTQINEQASFLEDTMLRLSNLQQTFRHSDQTNYGQSSTTNRQLDMFRSQIGNIKENFLLLEQENSKLHKEIASLKQKVQTNQLDIKAKDEEIKTKNTQINQLTTKLHQQTDTCNVIENEKYQHQNKVRQLQQQLQNKLKQIDQLNEKIQQLEMGVQISKIHQKQTPQLDNIHLQDSQQQNWHSKLYIDLHSLVYELKISPTPTPSKRIYSKLSISSIVNQFVPATVIIKIPQRQIGLNNRSQIPKQVKRVSQLTKKPINSYTANRQESQSISQIKVASQSSSKKCKKEVQPTVQIQIVKKNEQHQSSVYYSIDEQGDQTIKQKVQALQVSQQETNNLFKKPIDSPSSQKAIGQNQMKRKSQPHLATIQINMSQQQIESLQRKIQQLITQLHDKQDYIIVLEQQVKSNMNLKNQLQQLKQINIDMNQRSREKDKLVQELQDKIHQLMKQLSTSQKNQSYHQQQHNNHHSLYPNQLLNPSKNVISPICSQCSANLLQLQSMRKQLTSINLQLNSNKQQNIQLSQQVTILKSQNQNLKYSYSRLNQQYTVVQTKLQIANNQIDRVKSQLAIRTINQSRDNQKDYSKDGKDHPRQSSHSHQLLIISKGIQDKQEPQQSDKIKQNTKQAQDINQKPQLFYSLKVKQHSNYRKPSQKQQSNQQKLSLQNNSVKLNKKISQVNIRCTQAQKKSISSRLNQKQAQNIDNSLQQRQLYMSVRSKQPQKQPELRLSFLQKANTTYEKKIKEIHHQNQSLRDQLIQMNHDLNQLRKQHNRLLKDFQSIKQQNLLFRKQIDQLTKGKTQLQTEVQHFKHYPGQNQIRIHHIQNTEQPDAILHPQSSQGGQIRETAKFNPFDDLSPAEREKLQHDLEALGYKTQLKVDWGHPFTQKIRKTDRSDRSKTSDFKQIISLGGDNAIQPINLFAQNNNDITINNNTNDVSANDINQSKADLYQDFFFKDQQIEQLKIDVENQKEKVLKLQELCHQLRSQNQQMLLQKETELEEKNKQIQRLNIVIEEIEWKKTQIEQKLKQKAEELVNLQQKVLVWKQQDQKIEEKTQSIEPLKNKIKELQLIVAQRKLQASKLTNEVNHKNEQVMAIKSQVTKFKQNNSSLTKQLHLKITTLTTQQKTLTNQQKTIKQHEKTIKQLQLNEAKLKSQIQSRQQLLKQLSQQNQTSTQQLQHITRVNQKAKQNMSMLQKVYKQNYNQFKRIEDDYKQVIIQFQSLKEQDQLIKHQLETVKQQNNQLKLSHSKPSTNNHNHQHQQIAQIQKLKKQICSLKKNQQQYLQQINRIRLQGKQLKRQHPQEFSSISSSILNQTHSEDPTLKQKRQQILKLLQNISKTFKLLSLKKTTQKQSNSIENQQSKEEEMFRMITSLAARNQALQCQLSDIKTGKNSRNDQMIVKNKNNQEKTTTFGHSSKLSSPKNNNIKPNNDHKKLDFKPSSTEMTKQLSKKMTQLKLSIIKNLTASTQQAKQALIKQLNQITQLVDNITTITK